MTERNVNFTTPDGNTVQDCTVTYRPRATVEAMRCDGTAKGAGPIIDWVLTSDQSARYHSESGDWDYVPPRVTPAFSVLDGAAGAPGATSKIYAGDFVAKWGHGFIRVDGDTFTALYENALTTLHETVEP